MAAATAPPVVLLHLLVALQMLLLLLSSPAAVQAADSAAAGTTHLNLFMHDVVSGSSPTAVQVIKGPAGSNGAAAAALGMAFGDTNVVDDPLTATSSPTSAEVGRMQGLYMLSSQSGAVLMVCANLVLTSGGYNGSTLAVMGRDDTAADVRELSVLGGTGRFRMATGYVLWKTTAMSGADATVELNVYVTTSTGGGSNGTTVDASAPVSPVSGGAGAGGGSGSNKASSAALAGGAGAWVNAYACVVALVVAAVVGSGVW